MTRALSWSLIAALALSLAGTAAEAADTRVDRDRPDAYRSAPRGYAAERLRPQARVYPVIGIACDEGWGENVILRCPRHQVQIRPSEDDIEAWNAFTGLGGPQPRPYRQLFSWSR